MNNFNVSRLEYITNILERRKSCKMFYNFQFEIIDKKSYILKNSFNLMKIESTGNSPIIVTRQIHMK